MHLSCVSVGVLLSWDLQ